MQRIFPTLLLWTLVLGACSMGRPAPEIPSSSSPTDTPSPSDLSAATTEVPTFEGCAYQWAYQDLPVLSSNFQEAIRTLQAEAQARAFAFGENCVRADGRADFLAMETDFDVTLQATDVSNESELGEWIVRVMQVIENIPGEEIVGPRPGRVSIDFRSDRGQQFVKFYVDQYRSLPLGLSNAEIYQAFQTPQ